MVDLYIRYENNAIIGLPVRNQSGQRKIVPYSIGAWTQSGDAIGEAQLFRNNWVSHAVDFQQACDQHNEPFIYGGFIFKHYGHFLVETLSRIWAITNSGKKILWVADPSTSRFTRYQKEIFDLIGIEEKRHHVLQNPTKFLDLEIPTVGAVLPSLYHPMHANELAIYPFQTPKSGRRVWLSRSRLNDIKSKAVNEAIFEDVLVRQGWIILHPQEMSVKDQLFELSDAEIISGFDGSAFHTLMLGSNIQSKVIIIPRGTTPNISAMFQTISDTKGIEQYLLVLEMEKIGGDGRGSLKSKIVSIADASASLFELCKTIMGH